MIDSSKKYDWIISPQKVALDNDGFQLGCVSVVGKELYFLLTVWCYTWIENRTSQVEVFLEELCSGFFVG